MLSAQQVDNNAEIPDTVFKLVILGTDTLIETADAKMPIYERGETLNAIFDLLKGEEFFDKHIISGAETLGSNVHQKVIEAVWMALKAISEGKTTIQIAAHSRGGIETILFAHTLEKTLAFLKNDKLNAVNLLAELKKLNFNFDDDSYLRVNLNGRLGENVTSKDATLTFKTLQTKCDKHAPKGMKDHPAEHQINIDALLNNVKNNIQCEAFILDPVPGQHLTAMKYNWSVKAFFNIPKIISKIKLFYMQDERTALFEPVIPNHFNQKEENVQIQTLRGNHGTASGWLVEQYHSEKNPVTTIADEPIVHQGKHAGKKRGKKTRGTQEFTAAALVEFFGQQAFRAPKENEDKRVALDVIPSIKKAIHAYVKAPDLEKVKLKLYDKIQAASAEYDKLRVAQYGPRVMRGDVRTILNDYSDSREFSWHGELVPLLPYVNEEHIKLKIKAWEPLRDHSLIQDFLAGLDDLFSIGKVKKKAFYVHQDQINKLYKNPRVLERYTKYCEELMDRYISAFMQMQFQDENELSVFACDLNKIVKLAYKVMKEIDDYEAGTPLLEDKLAPQLKAKWQRVVDEKIKTVLDEKYKGLLEACRHVGDRGATSQARLKALIAISNDLNKLVMVTEKAHGLGFIDVASYNHFMGANRSLQGLLKEFKREANAAVVEEENLRKEHELVLKRANDERVAAEQERRLQVQREQEALELALLKAQERARQAEMAAVRAEREAREQERMAQELAAKRANDERLVREQEHRLQMEKEQDARELALFKQQEQKRQADKKANEKERIEQELAAKRERDAREAAQLALAKKAEEDKLQAEIEARDKQNQAIEAARAALILLRQQEAAKELEKELAAKRIQDEREKDNQDFQDLSTAMAALEAYQQKEENEARLALERERLLQLERENTARELALLEARNQENAARLAAEKKAEEDKLRAEIEARNQQQQAAIAAAAAFEHIRQQALAQKLAKELEAKRIQDERELDHQEFLDRQYAMSALEAYELKAQKEAEMVAQKAAAEARRIQAEKEASARELALFKEREQAMMAAAALERQAKLEEALRAKQIQDARVLAEKEAALKLKLQQEQEASARELALLKERDQAMLAERAKQRMLKEQADLLEKSRREARDLENQEFKDLSAAQAIFDEYVQKEEKEAALKLAQEKRLQAQKEADQRELEALHLRGKMLAKVSVLTEKPADVITAVKPKPKRERKPRPITTKPRQETKPTTELKHPLIVELNAEIKNLEMQHAKNKESHRVFIRSLRDLSASLNSDIELQRQSDPKAKIEMSAAGKIAVYSKEMVKELQVAGVDKIQVLRTFENKCKQTPGWEKFLNVIRAVCFAGVGFVVGMTIGMLIGMAAGSWSGPGAFVSAAIGAAMGGAKGAAIGVAVGAAGMSVASGLTSFWMFKKPEPNVKERAISFVKETQKSLIVA